MSVAHDPIAIAALLAELPELEAAATETVEVAKIALTKLRMQQAKIDAAMRAVRSASKHGWPEDHNSMTATEARLRQAVMQYGNPQNRPAMDAAINQLYKGAIDAMAKELHPPMIIQPMADQPPRTKGPVCRSALKEELNKGWGEDA